jgi:small membrane protein
LNWIQGLLIASIFALVVFLLRSRRSVQSQAWVKVAFLAFMFAGVYAVLRPNDTTVVAHWLGVDRGTDLMLYALIVAFGFSTLNAYLRFKDLELRYARLARAVALEGAQRPL